MKILIDNGHGKDTAGKRSPKLKDGNRLYEWQYTRQIARSIVEHLRKGGYDAELLTPEEYDVSIKERVRRANSYCSKLGSKNVILVSVHLDASSDDDCWHQPKGWSVRIAPNASPRSMRFATLLHTKAKNEKLKTRTPLPYQSYWVQNLGICRDTLCPTVLTENLFQDNRDDVAYLMTEKGFDSIVRLHVEAIKDYVQFIT